MLPTEHLWPIDEYWNFHAGGGAFKDLRVFTEAMDARYGRAASLEDYARKAQVMAYEGQRAMFEAYARNKYTSTGVIQWMMNNAWPSMIWHLYDYYLRPAGGYFGTKKACEPLHIQYSYDDRSVVVVNAYYQGFQSLKAGARVYDLEMAERFSKETILDLAPDSVARLFSVPEIQSLSAPYFVRLVLEDSSGKSLSTNFYWLSTKPEILDEETATWYYTPIKSYADFTALQRLPEVDLKMSSSIEHRGMDGTVRVSLENPSRNLAFFVHLRLTKGSGGEEVLPILWQDNYFSLIPGETKELTAEYQTSLLQGSTPVLELQGWNIKARTQKPRVP
jgi:exo-1,4-beta-D-glucosaminidase